MAHRFETFEGGRPSSPNLAPDARATPGGTSPRGGVTPKGGTPMGRPLPTPRDNGHLGSQVGRGSGRAQERPSPGLPPRHRPAASGGGELAGGAASGLVAPSERSLAVLRATTCAKCGADWVCAGELCNRCQPEPVPCDSCGEPVPMLTDEEAAELGAAADCMPAECDNCATANRIHAQRVQHGSDG